MSYGPGGHPPPGGYYGGPGQQQPPQQQGGWGAGPGAGYYAPPAAMGPGYQHDPQLVENAQLWLIIGAVTAGIICLPLGGIGAYMAHQAKQMAEQGDVAGARSKLGTAKILIGIGMAFGVLLILFWLGISILGASMGL